MGSFLPAEKYEIRRGLVTYSLQTLSEIVIWNIPN